MLTIKLTVRPDGYGCRSWLRIFRSLSTELTLRLARTRALDISFMAKVRRSFFFSMCQTRPKPPLPMTWWNWKADLVTVTMRE